MNIVNKNALNKIIFPLIFCVFFQVYNKNAHAQEYIIGVEDVAYYPLFDFKSNKNTFSKELLDKFAASKGYTFVYLPLPIKRFDKWLLEEKIDFKYPDNSRWYPDPNLKNQYSFSHSTIKLVAGTTVLKSFLQKDIAEFKSIGTLLGFYPTTWLEQIKSGQVALYEDVSTKILIRQLISNNIDGIDIEPSVIKHYLTELGHSAKEVVIDKRYRYDVYDYHFSTIKYPKIIKEFNQFLSKNKELIKKMKVKYNIIDHTVYLK